MEIDLDINSYSFNDLKQLLNIKTNDINKSELENNYINKKKELEKINDQDNYKNINQFIDNVYQHLKLHIKEPKIQNNIEKTNEILKIDNKLDYLINFNFENSKKLENIHSVNPINQSNIPLNPRTYNTIKKQIAINSNFRKKALTSLEDRLLLEKLHRTCGGHAIPGIVEDIYKPNNKESSTNFTIELSEPIDNVIALELVSTEIPQMIYTFSRIQRNYRFKITFYDDNDPLTNAEYFQSNEIDYTIIIPDGIWPATILEAFIGSNYLDFNVMNLDGTREDAIEVAALASTITSDLDATIKNHYLRYLTVRPNSTTFRMEIRFKTISELTLFNDTISNPNNQPKVAISLEYLNNLSYSLENIDDTIGCDNRVQHVQGFIDNNSSKDEQDFRFTTLGTIGFLEGQVYNIGNTISNQSQLTPIIIKHSDQLYKYKIGFLEFRGYLLGENIYGGDLTSAVYVRVNDFVGNRGEQIILTGRDQTQITNNVLSRIAFKSDGLGETNIFNSLQDYNIKRNYFGGVKISKLQIQIIDKYGRILNLNNNPTNFVFEFTIEYSSERLANFRNEMLNSNN